MATSHHPRQHLLYLDATCPSTRPTSPTSTTSLDSTEYRGASACGFRTLLLPTRLLLPTDGDSALIQVFFLAPLLPTVSHAIFRGPLVFDSCQQYSYQYGSLAIPVQPSATLFTHASLTASLGPPRLSDTLTARYSLEPWKQIISQHLLSGYFPSPCLLIMPQYPACPPSLAHWWPFSRHQFCLTC